MQELQNLETSQLIDLLAQHTADYTKLMSEGTTEEEFAKSRLIITALQSEIETRKTNESTNITTPPDFT